MDYQEIILQGYFDENNRQHLENYFYRELKKAEKENYEADEFINGCHKILNYWKSDLTVQINERKKELNNIFMLEKQKPKNTNSDEIIEYAKHEQKDVRPDGIGSLTYNMNLFKLTKGKVSYQMAYSEWQIIDHAIKSITLKVNLEKIKHSNKSQSNIYSTPLEEFKPRGVSDNDWSNKTNEQKKHIWGLHYANDFGNPVVKFLQGLEDNNNFLTIERRNLLEFIKSYKPYFEWFEPTISDHFKQIIDHPRFIRDNKDNIYSDVKDAVSEYLRTNLSPQTNKEPKNEKNQIELSTKLDKLRQVWLHSPKLSIEEFIQKGIDKALWNEDLIITIQRSASNYGTGKRLLGNIFIAFKNSSIQGHYDYKKAGKIFCEVFNIEVNENTIEKYKAFSSGNQKQIMAIKKTFNIY